MLCKNASLKWPQAVARHFQKVLIHSSQSIQTNKNEAKSYKSVL